MTDLDDLQAKAEAATPGPWEADDIYGLVAPTQIDGFAFPMDRQEAEWAIRADAEYIAAVSPDVVHDLIRRVREAENEMHARELHHFEVEQALEEAEGKIARALGHDPLHGRNEGLHCGGMSPCISSILRGDAT